MSECKFTAEDFDLGHADHNEAAAQANLKLEEWLERAPVVKAVNLEANWFHQDAECIARYQARIVMIEPIVKDRTATLTESQVRMALEDYYNSKNRYATITNVMSELFGEGGE